MRRVQVARLKDRLSSYLEYVRRGGRVVIYRRNEPVAELRPAQHTDAAGPEMDRLRALEQRGVVRTGSGVVPDELRRPPRGRVAGVLDALLEERAAGR